MSANKTLTQHEKRIGIMEALYLYFLEKQSQREFEQFIFEEEGISLLSQQCDILRVIIKYEHDLINVINLHLKTNWNFESLKPIEKAILILGAYEIIHTNVDRKIIINEAVIIAKTYCPNNAYKYINGVLDKINK